MQAPQRVRILLVDDHAVVRLGFRMLLAAHEWCEIVAEADSGESGYLAFREHRPDVVVMDLSLPKMSGIATIQRMRAVTPDARILVVSMHEANPYVVQSMRAGASGYVFKSSAPEELVKAVRAVARGGTYLSNELAQRMVMSDIRGEPNPFERLSAREFEIVSLATSGVAPREIAQRLSISYKTVVNYLSQAKRKLDVQSGAEMTRLALHHRIGTPGSAVDDNARVEGASAEKAGDAGHSPADVA